MYIIFVLPLNLIFCFFHIRFSKNIPRICSQNMNISNISLYAILNFKRFMDSSEWFYPSQHPKSTKHMIFVICYSFHLVFFYNTQHINKKKIIKKNGKVNVLLLWEQQTPNHEERIPRKTEECRVNISDGLVYFLNVFFNKLKHCMEQLSPCARKS